MPGSRLGTGLGSGLGIGLGIGFGNGLGSGLGSGFLLMISDINDKCLFETYATISLITFPDTSVSRKGRP